MYPLVDVDKPNVFRNLFHYDEIPKIAFNDRIVPHSMPDEIWITDTTFRDGQQSRTPYTTDQIVTLYDYFTDWADRMERSDSVNFSSTVKKTEMPFINVWSEDISFRRSQVGSVQARKTLNSERDRYERDRYSCKLF